MYIYGRARAYGELSSSFEILSLFDKDVLSPFLSNLVMVEVMEDALLGLQDVVIELANGEKLHNPDCADAFVCLFQFTKDVQRTPDRLAIRHALRAIKA